MRFAVTDDLAAPTSGGVPITNELIEQIVAEAEAGYDIGTLVSRGGRRPMGSGAVRVGG